MNEWKMQIVVIWLDWKFYSARILNEFEVTGFESQQ